MYFLGILIDFSWAMDFDECVLNFLCVHWFSLWIFHELPTDFLWLLMDCLLVSMGFMDVHQCSLLLIDVHEFGWICHGLWYSFFD